MPTPTDRRLVFLLNIGQRRLNRWIDARVGGNGGPTAASLGTLFYLNKRDGALIGEVGAALDLAPSAMSGLADRMAKSGLVERRRDAQDGRATRLHLTDQGRQALVLAKRGLKELNALLCEGFSDAEIDVVARWLGGLQTRLGGES